MENAETQIDRAVNDYTDALKRYTPGGESSLEIEVLKLKIADAVLKARGIQTGKTK